MHKQAILLLVACLLFISPFAASNSRADSPDSDPAIKLKVATFVPAKDELPSLPADLTVSTYAAGQRGDYIVQFGGPVQEVWKDAVAATGAELLGYIPDFAFKVRMTPAQAHEVRELSTVGWVGIFQPAYKLSPDLARNGAGLYVVRLERGATDQTRAAIVQNSAGVSDAGGDVLIVAADAAKLGELARLPDVAWIEKYRLPETHNEYGAGVIMGANTANVNGYDGSTQTVAVADTGLGGGTKGTAHVDIPAGRVTAIYNWPGVEDWCFTNIIDDGAVDVDSGHGTHVAVSVVGDGDSSGIGIGTAPAANLVFQSIENFTEVSTDCTTYYGINDGYYLTGLTDLTGLFQQAYDAGARVHSNSWGSNAAGDYTDNSAVVDAFIWDNSDMTISFSAGNAGVDANSDGIIDEDSIGAPGTAKNVITVGASENERGDSYPCDTGLPYTDTSGQSCSDLGGQNNIFTWGAGFGYPSEPIKSDPSAGSAEQMAAFSSRGPTDDGRIKPDVVAPGSWILSGYSGLHRRGYDGSPNSQNGAWQYDGYGYPYNQDYKYLSGTSMSNPLTAGAATVVRDYYEKTRGHDASAALVKATLINSAVDLLDENNDGSNDNDYPIPNVHEGWGRVNVENATDHSHRFTDATAGVSTGSSATYTYTVGAGSPEPLKVTLVWSDYPSTQFASQNLVNDLDLVVTSPSSTTYRGNVFSGGWSQAGGSADRTNNVENMYVQSPEAGVWTVEVSGYNVPNGPQPYALVVDGANQAPQVNIVSPTANSVVSGTVTIQVDATDAEDTAAGALTTEVKIDDGAWQTASHNAGSGYYELDWDTTQATFGSHTVHAHATDSNAVTATAQPATITVNNYDYSTYLPIIE